VHSRPLKRCRKAGCISRFKPAAAARDIEVKRQFEFGAPTMKRLTTQVTEP
jgi:hypothetical protein